MIDIQKVQKAMILNGHTIFEQDDKPYNLNIVGIRSSDNTPNIFNDWLTVFYKFEGQWNFHIYKFTTDPGLYWLNNPMDPKGCAILMPGQYLGCFERGMHQGKYPALVQVKPMTIIRDFNRDDIIDFNTGTMYEDIIGLNLHRANSKWESQRVDKWSGACQVVPNPTRYDQVITMVDESIKHWGNSFSYTLLEEKDLNL